MKGEYKLRSFICLGCSETVKGHLPQTRKYCSKECFYSNKPMHKTSITKECLVCHNIFTVPHCRKSAITCSKACSNSHQGRNKISFNCPICKQSKLLSPFFVKGRTRKYCSLKCRDNDPKTKLRLLQMNVNQMKKSPNRLELNLYETLSSLDIKYIPQYIVNNKFAVDAFVPSIKLAIQVDGDYWHTNPNQYSFLDSRQLKRVSLDKSQDAYMKKVGINVIRFWESDIKLNPTIIYDTLKSLLP